MDITQCKGDCPVDNGLGQYSGISHNGPSHKQTTSL